MKAVIMAGGFAKRMYPLTENQPKPMLKVGGRPVIDHVIEKIGKIAGVDEILVTTNIKFMDIFSGWMAGVRSEKPVRLIIESAQTDEQKLGSIGALNMLVKNENIVDDMLVVAGDNIFTFDLKPFIGVCKDSDNIWIGIYDVRDVEQAKKLGVVKIKENKITGFWEKPQNPATTLASTGIYFYPRKTFGLISEYISNGNNPDAPGFFLQWLHKKEDVFGFVFNRPSDRWFDIGSFEALQEANKQFGAGKADVEIGKTRV